LLNHEYKKIEEKTGTENSATVHMDGFRLLVLPLNRTAVLSSSFKDKGMSALNARALQVPVKKAESGLGLNT
jgi:hypothetical protein